MKKALRVQMPDGSKWDVPIKIIAWDRAKHYAHEFGGDIERSLKDDTMPLFEDHDYEIKDWACNNMNWSDVKDHAAKVSDQAPMTEDDFQEGWCNGDKEIV